MMMNQYGDEKVRELEQELACRDHVQFLEPHSRRHRPVVFGPLADGVGRVLQRMGEGLERWASPPATDCSESMERTSR